ncbi:UNVERIFIED_CONTAM: hypothetical protein Slati_4229600 [Sesamum latifolium]|uniref:DUF4218 domain-containing protein n=1 Tax=Sesamum latifolium TaxID=2727402 RepID=A0AAW2TBW5_9LAMI
MPRDHTLPFDYYNTKKLIKDLGLPMEKIDVYKNGCILYWKDDIDLDYCKFCGGARYKPTRVRNPNRKKTPYAVLSMPPTKQRRDPYATRLMQRRGGILTGDPNFAVKPRNVRFGLCTNGLAPHSSTVARILVGLSNPKRLIDIYLESLIEELQNLWHMGVQTRDNAKDETFTIRAALMWTVNDLSAYGMASGWSTAGVLGCPVCMEDTRAFYLQNAPLSHPDGYGSEHKWTKKSIFWELEYWSTHLIRHNLDVMHIEKNVFDNIFNTMMDIKGKTKDNLNARKDLQIICNRPKFPDGYASNLSRCVDMASLRLHGMKSHDCHVYMQKLIPIAFHEMLPESMWACMGGPIQYRWMYPFERFLRGLKMKVKNEAHVEASIVEAYLVEEIDLFTSQYFEPQVLCKRNKPGRNDELTMNDTRIQQSIFNFPGRASGASKKRWLNVSERHIIETYILTNCEVVTPYYESFLNELYEHYHSDDPMIEELVATQFKDWVKCRISGPSAEVTTFQCYFINGYNFHTERYSVGKSTFNCRVCVKSSSYTNTDSDLYGILEEVIQIDYPLIPNMQIVRGMKVHPRYHLVDVNFKKVYQKNEPFILAQ